MITQVGVEGSDRCSRIFEPKKAVVIRKMMIKPVKTGLKKKSKSNEHAQKIMRMTLNKRTIELSHLIGKVLLELKEET